VAVEFLVGSEFKNGFNLASYTYAMEDGFSSKSYISYAHVLTLVGRMMPSSSSPPSSSLLVGGNWPRNDVVPQGVLTLGLLGSRWSGNASAVGSREGGLSAGGCFGAGSGGAGGFSTVCACAQRVLLSEDIFY